MSRVERATSRVSVCGASGCGASRVGGGESRFVEARFDVVALTGNELVHIKDAWRL